MPAASPSASRSDQRARGGTALGAGRGVSIDAIDSGDGGASSAAAGRHRLRSAGGGRARGERLRRGRNHASPVQPHRQRLSIAQHHGVAGTRAIDGHDAALHLEIEARLRRIPFDEEGGAVHVYEERPRLNLPIRSRPMRHLHVRAPILEHQAGAAPADVEHTRAGARHDMDVRPVREGELRLVPGGRANVAAGRRRGAIDRVAQRGRQAAHRRSTPRSRRRSTPPARHRRRLPGAVAAPARARDANRIWTARVLAWTVAGGASTSLATKAARPALRASIPSTRALGGAGRRLTTAPPPAMALSRGAPSAGAASLCRSSSAGIRFGDSCFRWCSCLPAADLPRCRAGRKTSAAPRRCRRAC